MMMTGVDRSEFVSWQVWFKCRHLESFYALQVKQRTRDKGTLKLLEHGSNITGALHKAVCNSPQPCVTSIRLFEPLAYSNSPLSTGVFEFVRGGL
jgi:hypothetical protein